MGLFDAFRKKSFSSKNSFSDYSSTAEALGGVYAIIDTLWGEDKVKEVVAGFKEDIKTIIIDEDVRRKTDLLEYGLESSIELLSNAKKNPQTTLGSYCITAFIYYRLFFECVLALDDDIIHVAEQYTIFQATKFLEPKIHLYVQTMIKIYDLLDRGIVYHYEKMFNSTEFISEDYFTIVAKKIHALLNNYTDDNTSWNKISPQMIK